MDWLTALLAADWKTLALATAFLLAAALAFPRARNSGGAKLISLFSGVTPAEQAASPDDWRKYVDQRTDGAVKPLIRRVEGLESDFRAHRAAITPMLEEFGEMRSDVRHLSASVGELKEGQECIRDSQLEAAKQIGYIAGKLDALPPEKEKA